MVFSHDSPRLRVDQRSGCIFSQSSPAHVLTLFIFSLQTTTQTQTTILTYIFALCLRVDDYAADTTLIAGDLAMPVIKCVPLVNVPYHDIVPYFPPRLSGSTKCSRLLVSGTSSIR